MQGPRLLSFLLHHRVEIRPREEVSREGQNVLWLVLEHLLHEDTNQGANLGMRSQVPLVLHIDLDVRLVQLLLLLLRQDCNPIQVIVRHPPGETTLRRSGE